MKASEFCEVCTHDDILEVEKVLERLAVYETLDGKYAVVNLDSEEHFDGPPLVFDSTIPTADLTYDVSAPSVIDWNTLDNDDDDDDWIDEHWENMGLLEKFMNITVPLVESSVKAGYPLFSGRNFNYWLYNEIGKTVDAMRAKSSSE